MVRAGQLPDGILDVLLVGESEPASFVIEIATYPERRVEEQLTRDTILVCLNRRELPEVITLVLRPKGRLRVPEVISLRSRGGGTGLELRCRVVELWTVPAEQLLATDRPGVHAVGAALPARRPARNRASKVPGDHRPARGRRGAGLAACGDAGAGGTALS